MEANTGTTPPPAEPTVVDAAVSAMLTAAVEVARAAIAEHSGADAVGEYLGVSIEDAAAATHRFLAEMPGYRGWQWAVVVAAYPGADRVTVSEVVLVPGPTALLAPEWVPWEQRVRPGDLGPGDLLATPAYDPRLVPGYLASGDPQVDETAAEIGLGRRRVLSVLGRAEAAQRWHDGDYGPGAPMARSTKRVCRTCGFLLPLAGSLGRMFGVCSNEMSADGRVVDFEYGCGAHSDTPAPAGSGSPTYEPYDDGVLDVDTHADAAGETPAEEAVETPADETGAPDVTDAPDTAVATPAVEAAETAAVAETDAADPAVETPPDVADTPDAPVEISETGETVETPAEAPEASDPA